MQCQDCKKNPAVLHFTQILNQQKTMLNLCKECAEKRGIKTPFSGSAFSVENLLAKMADPQETEDESDLSCAACGLKYSDFKSIGRLGCGDCYTAFAPKLDQLLRKIHGANTHLGKIPKAMGKTVFLKRKVESLRTNLLKAIAEENFEDAARLRDEIHRSEESGSGS
jgi:protein arginine kinase activator